jgi:hypothetical protein
MVTRSLCLLFLLALSAAAQTPRIPPPESVNRNGLVGRWLVDGFNAGTNLLFAGANAVASEHGFYRQYGTRSGGTLTSGNSFRVAAVPFDYTNNFTVSLWVWTTNQTTTAGRLFSWRDGLQNGLEAYIYQSSGDFAIAAYTTEVRLSLGINKPQWVHLAVAYRSPNFVIYRNGATANTGTLSTFGNVTSKAIHIGNRSTLDRTFVGFISDVRIYNRAVSADEIKRIYRGLE